MPFQGRWSIGGICALLLAACERAPTPPISPIDTHKVPGPPALIRIVSSLPIPLPWDASPTLTATVHDANGTVLTPTTPFTWKSSDTTVLVLWTLGSLTPDSVTSSQNTVRVTGWGLGYAK